MGIPVDEARPENQHQLSSGYVFSHFTHFTFYYSEKFDSV